MIPGFCKVTLENSTYKRVDEIQKGDILHNGAKVVCVMKTNILDKTTKFVKLNASPPLKELNFSGRNYADLYITPWHPIYDIGSKWSWAFPIEIGNVCDVPINCTYSFLLDKIHIIEINDFPCVTLGHRFTDFVRSHFFFGTELVVQEMKKIPGFQDGLIEISQYKWDPVSRKVHGFKLSTSYTIPLDDKEVSLETKNTSSDDDNKEGCNDGNGNRISKPQCIIT